MILLRQANTQCSNSLTQPQQPSELGTDDRINTEAQVHWEKRKLRWPRSLCPGLRHVEGALDANVRRCNLATRPTVCAHRVSGNVYQKQQCCQCEWTPGVLEPVGLFVILWDKGLDPLESVLMLLLFAAHQQFCKVSPVSRSNYDFDDQSPKGSRAGTEKSDRALCQVKRTEHGVPKLKEIGNTRNARTFS